MKSNGFRDIPIPLYPNDPCFINTANLLPVDNMRAWARDLFNLLPAEPFDVEGSETLGHTVVCIIAMQMLFGSCSEDPVTGKKCKFRLAFQHGDTGERKGFTLFVPFVNEENRLVDLHFHETFHDWRAALRRRL